MKGKGYSLKVILVPFQEVVDKLGSGDTGLVKDILRDKKNKELFDQVELKRPFVFEIKPPKGAETTSPMEKEQSEAAAIMQEAKPYRTVQQCIKQLIKPNNNNNDIQQDASDDTQQQQQPNQTPEQDDTQLPSDDDGRHVDCNTHSNEADVAQSTDDLQDVTNSDQPVVDQDDDDDKPKPTKSVTKKKKHDYDDDNDDSNDVLDDRIGYKYLYGLEAIISRCESARYLDTKRWANFRPGYISDVQVHAFKTGIDLDWHEILERGVPTCFQEKKKFPNVLDYPTVGYLQYTELAGIVCRLIPDDDDDAVAADGVDGDLDDVRHGDQSHIHNEAIAEFKGWIETSITECKDLIFFIY